MSDDLTPERLDEIERASLHFLKPDASTDDAPWPASLFEVLALVRRARLVEALKQRWEETNAEVQIKTLNPFPPEEKQYLHARYAEALLWKRILDPFLKATQPAEQPPWKGYKAPDGSLGQMVADALDPPAEQEKGG